MYKKLAKYLDPERKGPIDGTLINAGLVNKWGLVTDHGKGELKKYEDEKGIKSNQVMNKI